MRVSPHLSRRLLHGWLLLMVAGLGVVGAMAANAARRAMAAHAEIAATSPPARGYEADDHFPGAALLYLADTPAPPRPGTTGTTELPPLPISAARTRAPAAADSGVVPARPFSIGPSTSLDRARAAECLTDVVYYEAASEPDAGQRAVAQVVLNRVRHPAFPMTVCGVVFQGTERGRCQFSFACDGAMTRLPSRVGWTRAARVAAAALAGYVFAPVGLATHYHTYDVTPAWNRSLVMTDAVGAHFFHRWKGYWGTAAAFGRAYRGGEPVPGPSGPAVVVPIAPAPAVLDAPSAILTISQRVSTAAPNPGADDHLPPASRVLDRWKDSGKPL